MLDLALVLARLQTLDAMESRVALSATIGDAVDVQIAQDRYLWLAGPSGASEGNEVLGGAVHQVRAQRFSIVSLVRNVHDAAGAGALTEMTSLRAAVVAALLGWQPTPEWAPLEHVRDAAVRWDGGRLYWADEFRTDHRLSSI